MSDYVAPPSSASGPTGPRASFFRRLGAFLVDWIMLVIVSLVLQAAAGRNVGGAIGLVIGISYLGFFEGSASGQTIGKKLLGIRVIDYRTGGPIGYGRGVLRYVARYLSAIPCGLGYFWMLWDKERQTWHDKLISDVVVPVSSYPVSSWPN